MPLGPDAIAAILDDGAIRRKVVLAATAALATGAYVAIDTGIPNQDWFLRRVRLKQVSGTAATWNLRFGASNPIVAGDEYIRLRDDDAELSTAQPINESLSDNDGWVVSDANGIVWMLVTFGSATDHVVSGSFLLEPIRAIS